nr:hypothetical protein [Tanacetum cinerariifolium]
MTFVNWSLQKCVPRLLIMARGVPNLAKRFFKNLKTTLDESNLWHRRLGHINFKTMNKLVKGNLVRGLPTKVFKNDHTCVACKKGKQHKASCKTKPVSSVNQPLQRLHMDLFRPTFVKSLNKKSYCLVVTDDYSRFTWVFFLATKDETTPILKTFITGKFDGKVDEGFLVGYSVSSKAFRVFNSRTRIVQETLHIIFLENKPNVAGSGPTWLFDIDTLIRTMNYQPVTTGNQSNPSAGVQEQFDAEKAGEEIVQQYVLFPVWSSGSNNPQNTNGDATFKVNAACPLVHAVGQIFTNNTKTFSTAGPSNTIVSLTHGKSSYVDTSQLPDDPNMPKLEDITYSDNEEDVGAKVDFTNLEKTIIVSPIPTTRVHKDHPVTQIIGDLSSATQTRSMTRVAKDQGGLSQIDNDDSIHVCLPAFFHKKNPKGNKKDERSMVVRNKAQLVAQGHTQEEGIDYEEVFDPVARIEAIRLFLAYASFMGFMVYQMEVKSAFLYGTIEEEVYVCQPLGFEDLDYPDKVYKVVKALYGLHQAPRAWYETLANYLLENGFQRGKIDQALFIKSQKGDILLVHIYVNDIIFCSTNKDLCKAFEKLMKDKFQMSSIGELIFFLGLQVKQKQDGIFISQDKYVAEILRKFGLTDEKSASTPIDTEKPLFKDPDDQMVSGKDSSNPLMANNLPKIVWYSTHHVALMKSWLVQKQTALDDAESINCLPNEEIFTELSRMGYEKPSTKITFYKAFFSSQWKAQVGDLSSHSTKYSSPALTKKVFANMRRVGKGFLKVDTPLFECMIVAQQVDESVAEVNVDDVPVAGVADEGAADVNVDDVFTAVDEPSIPSPTPPTQPPLPSQDLLFTSQVQPTPPPSPIAQPPSPQQQTQPSHDAKILMDLLHALLETWRRNKLRVSKLRRLKKVRTSQRVDTSDDTVMDDVSRKGRIIADMDADEDITLKDVVNISKEVVVDAEIKESADVQGRQAESQAQIYQINLEHADKVLMVTTASATITVAAPTLTTALSAARRKKGVVIKNPKETDTPSTIIHTEPKSKDNGKGILDDVIDHVQRKEKEDNVVMRYQALKRKPQTEAQARKNMIYLRNMAGFKMDYFKGMKYDDIRPIFVKYFNYNLAFLENTKEQMEEEDNRALKRANESKAEKAAKKQKLNEEVAELKRHIQIVPNDEDDVYT